ncbi:toxin C-terminal domain-containing protein [Stenoxybacter acetivorans]|uniref:toxin C-terminal domain-containing protein n=1 Tax=Stenoxybacter acetivorans TaxID=422441 RepID=UPI00068E4A31|nr:VENN motif pre-toxin domain-containing protein [Stenoxybacter acetivorans]
MTQEFSQNVQTAQTELNKSKDAINEKLKNPDLTAEQRAELEQKHDNLDNLGLLLNVVSSGLSAPTDSLGGILAASASPVAAHEIGQFFKEQAAQNDDGKLTKGQEAAHIAAHAILGAAVAAAGGNDAVTSALAAGGAELATPVVSQWLYGTSDPKELTAEQKETLSSIGGLIGAGVGATTGDIGSIVSGSQAAQNAVDNNAVKAAATGLKVLYKSAKKFAKNGKINISDLKQTLKDEGLDILDNAMTLADGQITWDDAKAIIDLAVGTGFNKANKGEALKKINDIVDKNNRKSTQVMLKTTADATRDASRLGYSKTKDYPFDSHGQAVYKRGNKYITRDADGHNGGVWKIYDSKGDRKGTADENLNIIKE